MNKCYLFTLILILDEVLLFVIIYIISCVCDQSGFDLADTNVKENIPGKLLNV